MANTSPARPITTTHFLLLSPREHVKLKSHQGAHAVLVPHPPRMRKERKRAVVQNAARGFFVSCVIFLMPTRKCTVFSSEPSFAQFVNHALRKRMVVGSTTAASSRASPNESVKTAHSLCPQGFESPRCPALQSKALLMSSEDQDFEVEEQ